MSDGATSVADHSLIKDSEPLEWDRTTTAARWPAELDRLVDHLEASQGRTRALRSADRLRLRETLGAMLLGLYALRRASEGRWATYSRNNSDYGPGQTYAHPHATGHSVTTVADYLAAQGLVEQHKGFMDRTAAPFPGAPGKGFRSRIRALPALQELVEDRCGITPASLGRAEWAPLVRLKAKANRPGGDKALLSYSPTPETQQWTGELVAINSFLSTFRIELARSKGRRLSPATRKLIGRSFSPVRLYRVFNNASWHHGGRFYGGWWQELPKAERRHMLINGESTVELDYRSLHPRLCYQLSGSPLAPDVDPYDLPDFTRKSRRDLVKKTLNLLLNMDPAGRPRAPSGAAEVLPKGVSFGELVARLIQAHAPIRRWFSSGRGVELQRIDSDIAKVILLFFKGQGICCLPVHDSFIVSASAERLLGHAMCLAYSTKLADMGFPGPYPPLSGWSSTEAEADMMAGLPPL